MRLCIINYEGGPGLEVLPVILESEWRPASDYLHEGDDPARDRKAQEHFPCPPYRREEYGNGFYRYFAKTARYFLEVPDLKTLFEYMKMAKKNNGHIRLDPGYFDNEPCLHLTSERW